MLKRLFGLDRSVTNVKTEIIAGITTFLTMAYILAVNPNILSAAGMDKGALFTTTVLASFIPTLMMGLYAKLPFAQAPCMGLNAFFVYTVCLTMGYSWQFALTAVLIEGLVFILLTITNLREKIVHAIPKCLHESTSVGIGLFIAFIGLQNAGLIVGNKDILVSLGDIGAPDTLLAIIGLIVTSILLVRKVKGALLIGIILTAIIGVPMGVTKFEGFVSTPPSIKPLFCQFEWSHILSKDMFIVVFTLLFIDLFDTIGTLIGVSAKANMLDKEGNPIRMRQAFMCDAIGTTLGACLGTSTVGTYVESAAGVSEGGRSGLTATTTAVCFLLCLFFSPFFLSLPSAATAPVLILVGVMMVTNISKIDFENYLEAIPAFICMIMMPLAYSISDGIIFGVLSYVLIHVGSGHFRKVKISTYVLAVLFLLKFVSADFSSGNNKQEATTPQSGVQTEVVGIDTAAGNDATSEVEILP
ncbi:MAG: NCS2 family permease [Alistipes sp.]|nr:NCS2 family permease [Alistipes sp.]